MKARTRDRVHRLGEPDASDEVSAHYREWETVVLSHTLACPPAGPWRTH
jgi:hypothetical protein